MRLPMVAAICLITVTAYAQDKSIYTFGDIKVADFKPAVYSIDSNATAVILADVGSTSFTGNRKGWFTLVYKRHTRIRILNKTAQGLATILIPLYNKEDDEETLENVKASTYNELNGTVTETALDKHDLFTERQDKNHSVKKFTLPAVREGSIIDFAYTINSDFEFNLQPWTFQHIGYPCLWSEYAVAVPQLLNYVFIRQGVNKFYTDKKEQGSQSYHISQSKKRVDLLDAGSDRDYSVDAIVFKHRWVMKEVPAFRHVDYVSSPDNYLDRIEFQLSQISEGEEFRDVMTTWPKVAEEMMKKEDFGSALSQDNFWLDDELNRITGNSPDLLESAQKIYRYVQDNFTCTGEGFFIKTKLQDVYKSKKGNSGEINLLLTALLRKKGITAYPVLTSTRENGKAYQTYPVLSRFNYAFCRASINNNFYFLDACHSLLAFGKLDPSFYNGTARVMNTAADSFELTPDSLKENKNILVVVANDDNGNMTASLTRVPGWYESYQLRREIAAVGKNAWLEGARKKFSIEARLDSIWLESLTDLKEPLQIHSEFRLTAPEENKFYMNPLFGEGAEKNPFKAEERIYPVELDFPVNSIYSLSFEIPKGYEVEELPKSVMVKLNEKGDGLFEYRIQQNETQIALRTRLVIKRTLFEADEYDMLREFYNLVVKKQNELIVFKKKN